MENLNLDVDYSTALCFACGEDNPIGLKLKPVYSGEEVRAEFTPGEFHQGWDNVTHGGILYTLLDEITAYAILCHGIDFGVTARSEVRFRHIAPINEPIQISGRVTKSTKRLVETSGVLKLRDGTIIAEANSLFYVWRQSRKTVLWDLDGVIVDSASYHFDAWKETFAKRGKDFTREDFNEFFGTRNDFIIRNAMGDSVGEKDIELMTGEKETRFRERIKGNVKAFPGAIELLTAVKKGNFKLGLVSSAPRKNVDLVLDELGIRDYFNCITTGREARESKPSPEIFLLAAEKCGAEPRHCIVIEDSPSGIKAARGAGMKCLAVTTTHKKEALSQANRRTDSLEEIDLITLIQRT
ncbi:MAG: HAD-IA family hydrolase [Dehalococcoidia bacterium]|nr:HAD-IA family hydrolase [Dehalococcoidia bacterium]